jgi:hypothetical protein
MFQCYFVHHRSNTDWPGIKSGFLRIEADDQPSELQNLKYLNGDYTESNWIPGLILLEEGYTNLECQGHTGY